MPPFLTFCGVAAASFVIKGILSISSQPGMDMNQDDQAAASYAFLSGKFGIALDYQCTLLQSAFKSLGQLDLDKSRHRWFNNVTNQYPVIMHFNGNKRPYLSMADAVAGRKGGMRDYSQVPVAPKKRIHGLDFDRVCNVGSGN